MSAHPLKTVRAGDRCPECDGPGVWRRGVGFEHEKICMSPACRAAGGSTVWEPGAEYVYRAQGAAEEPPAVPSLGEVRCVVACVAADGTPSFFPCVVACTQDDYHEGTHYDLAKDQAWDAGYEQCGVVYDENDGPAFLFRELFPVGTAKNSLPPEG